LRLFRFRQEWFVLARAYKYGCNLLSFSEVKFPENYFSRFHFFCSFFCPFFCSFIYFIFHIYFFIFTFVFVLSFSPFGFFILLFPNHYYFRKHFSLIFTYLFHLFLIFNFYISTVLIIFLTFCRFFFLNIIFPQNSLCL